VKTLLSFCIAISEQVRTSDSTDLGDMVLSFVLSHGPGGSKAIRFTAKNYREIANALRLVCRLSLMLSMPRPLPDLDFLDRADAKVATDSSSDGRSIVPLTGIANEALEMALLADITACMLENPAGAAHDANVDSKQE
jgi:hypothetical protein